MKDRKRLLHRVAYMSQVRDRRKTLNKSVPLSLEDPIQDKQEVPVPEKKPSLFQKLLQRFFPEKRKQAEKYKINPSIREHKRFATEVRSYNELNNEVNLFVGMDIVATSREEAQFLIDKCGLGFLNIIGEKVASYDEFGNDVTNEDRLN